VEALVKTIKEKALEWAHVIKIGRTHLQDATPLTVGQEWSGYFTQLKDALDAIKQSMNGLYKLAAGGTAVGTGLNAPKDFGQNIASEISKLTGHPFVGAPNKFAAQGSLDAMVNASAALRLLAVALMKITNDIRWLGSGPRAGLHELNLPANEPGSSIMPGKVNPTQEEAMIMVCIQVIGNDTAVAIAGSQGNFELNAMRPIIIKNVLHSSSILGDASDKLRRYSIEGITLDKERIIRYLNDSLMLVTALSSVIGYDKASFIAHKAFKDNLTLRDAAISSGHISAEDFDRIVVPANMVGDPDKDLSSLSNS
jgi:fumarate hydratase, class II